MYGFGSTPVKYKWNDMPRNVIGEGIVMNVTRNACAIFVTYSKMTCTPATTSKANSSFSIFLQARASLLARAFFFRKRARPPAMISH